MSDQLGVGNLRGRISSGTEGCTHRRAAPGRARRV